MHKTKRPAGTKHHNRKLAALSLCGIGLLAACGSSSTSGTSAPSASPSVSVSVHAASGPATSSSGIPCAKISSLRTSLTNLSHTTLSQASAGQLTSELANVGKQLAALKGQSGGAFSAQASQLSSALSQITKDANTLVSHPSSANLSALTEAVQKLKTTAQPIIKEMTPHARSPDELAPTQSARSAAVLQARDRTATAMARCEHALVNLG